MSFHDIKGQDRPIEIIKEHIKQSRLGHAYLFCGPEGVGKRLLAKTLAKAVNCLNPIWEIPGFQPGDERGFLQGGRDPRLSGRGGSTGNPDSCDSCLPCLKIDRNQHPDVHFLDDGSSEDSLIVPQLDTKSIKIDAIRNLQKEANLRPYEAKIKVFIIDNAHNLTPEAANALLKILEEPPKDNLIILISSKAAVLFKTIISRCQIIKFYPMPRTFLSDILRKDYNLDNNLAHFLAFFCEGRLGGALKFKDTGIFSEKNRIIDEFCMTDNPGLVKMPAQNRQDMRAILNILALWFRDIYMLKSGMPLMELINLDRKDDLLKASSSYSFVKLDKTLSLISDSLSQIKQNINVKLLLANLKWALK